MIDLSVGTPNIPPVERIRRALADAALDPKNYVYAIRDTSALQKAAAVWYKRRYGVELDPETQIESLLGSQEGFNAHLPFDHRPRRDGSGAGPVLSGLFVRAACSRRAAVLYAVKERKRILNRL